MKKLIFTDQESAFTIYSHLRTFLIKNEGKVIKFMHETQSSSQTIEPLKFLEPTLPLSEQIGFTISKMYMGDDREKRSSALQIYLNKWQAVDDIDILIIGTDGTLEIDEKGFVMHTFVRNSENYLKITATIPLFENTSFAD